MPFEHLRDGRQGGITERVGRTSSPVLPRGWERSEPRFRALTHRVFDCSGSAAHVPSTRRGCARRYAGDAVGRTGSAAAGIPSLQPSDLSVGRRLKVEGIQGVGADEAVGSIETTRPLEEFDR